MRFEAATSFNQPLSDWEFPNVTDMSFMFHGATSFNNGAIPKSPQPIGARGLSDWKFPRVADGLDLAVWKNCEMIWENKAYMHHQN